MKKFTQWIAAKAIKDHQSVNDLKVRSRYGTLERLDEYCYQFAAVYR